MNKLIKWFLIVRTTVVASFFFCFCAYAQVASSSSSASSLPSEPGSVEEAAKLIPVIIDAIKNGQWLLVGAIATLILVFVFRQYILPKTGLTTNVVPIVSAGLGMIVGAGIAVAGGATPLQAVLATLSGPLASTLWQAIAKYLMPKAPESVQPVK